jgi:hypothetical protein
MVDLFPYASEGIPMPLSTASSTAREASVWNSLVCVHNAGEGVGVWVKISGKHFKRDSAALITG